MQSYHRLYCIQSAVEFASAFGVQPLPKAMQYCWYGYNDCMSRDFELTTSAFLDCPHAAAKAHVTVGDVTACMEAYFTAMDEYSAEDCKGLVADGYGTHDYYMSVQHAHDLADLPECNASGHITGFVLGDLGGE